MLCLPNVTLVALSNKDFRGHDLAIAKSCEGVQWGGVKLIYDYTIRSIDDWNYKVLFELHNYIATDYCLLIHADGYVVNPASWREEFLDYDYVGAPWPLPRDPISYRTPKGELIRVGNSVSLRSKRILRLPSELGLEFKPFWGNTNEDGKLCVEWRDILREHGVRYAPLDVAKHFSREHTLPENEHLTPFAFHTVD